MISTKKILYSFAVFVCSYFLFVHALHWSFKQETAVSRLFLQASQCITGSVLSDAFIMMLPPEKSIVAPNSYKMEIKYTTKEAAVQAARAAKIAGKPNAEFGTLSITIDLFLLLIIPLSFLLSLTIVTPVTWRAKVRNMLVGTTLFLTFTWLRIVLFVLMSIAIREVDMYQWVHIYSKTLYSIDSTFGLGGTLIVAILIWAFLSFGKNLPFVQEKPKNKIKSTAQPISTGV